VRIYALYIHTLYILYIYIHAYIHRQALICAHIHYIHTRIHIHTHTTHQFEMGSSDENDEATFTSDGLLDGARAVYSNLPVPTNRRVFVVIMLDDEGRDALSNTVKGLRERFPLDERVLDKVLRWVDRYVGTFDV
jgi:hypothetical protein